ncbi:MAG TPA: tRNA (guanosine(37)-N1)-methyltransferase TrmD [Clostridiaceae bacterium]|nr:tRNA (guanosine(37)-N1)-methyltransferase TrmD [Clostridiaceae bacterium]
MKIEVLTLFPDMFRVFDESIIGRGKEKGLFSICAVNIRDYSTDKHKKVDDYPYGGGSGLVMRVQPIRDAILALKKENSGPVIFLGPRGKAFDQEMAQKLAKEEQLIFVCGHYEGIDERLYRDIDEEISLGDFILTGGEMAAIPIIDSILRLREGVLGTDESSVEESFTENLLEYPHYTRPDEVDGERVPEVLLSGHHENIRQWRRYQMLTITKEKRPDLYEQHKLSKDDLKILKKYGAMEKKEE